MKVVFICLDTARVDHFGCYGHPFNTTANVDKIAQQGVVFRRCYASDVPTPPEYTAIFSGRFGIHTGIFGFEGPSAYRPGPPMLQEILARQGWRTGAISNLFYTCPWLFRGWHDVSPPGLRFQGGRAPEVTDEAIRWLKNHGEGDFFLFVHYWEPHQPYTKAPQEHRKLFPTESYKRIAPDMRVLNSNPIMKTFYKYYHAKGEGDANMPAEEVLARYDSQIHFADEEVGRFVEYLDQCGIGEDALLIVASDHGEAFGEYGFIDHYTCYENISHVPLVLRFPGRLPSGTSVEGFVYGADLMPTILELAGLDVPAGVDGVSFLPAAREGKDTARDFIVTDCNALVTQRMMVQDQWALAHTIHPGPQVHIKPYELFDLEGDQERDVSLDHAEKKKEMQALLAEWLAEHLHGGPDPLQQAAREGGWMLSHPAFIHSMLEHLELVRKNHLLWETLLRRYGPGLELLRAGGSIEPEWARGMGK